MTDMDKALKLARAMLSECPGEPVCDQVECVVARALIESREPVEISMDGQYARCLQCGTVGLVPGYKCCFTCGRPITWK